MLRLVPDRSCDLGWKQREHFRLGRAEKFLNLRHVRHAGAGEQSQFGGGGQMPVQGLQDVQWIVHLLADQPLNVWPSTKGRDAGVIDEP